MRDTVTEGDLLTDGAELADRVYGQRSAPFARVVATRLAKGAAEYGDNAFLARDNLIEALEEPPDATAYALLEYQRLAPGLSPVDRAELRQYTLGVIAAAVNLDAALRRLQHAREELLG